MEEILISDILYEYHKNFEIQKEKILSSNMNLENNLLIDKDTDISQLINSKICIEFSKFVNDFSKLEKWFKRYLESMDELNNGLLFNSSQSQSNINYLEAKNLLNNEIE